MGLRRIHGEVSGDPIEPKQPGRHAAVNFQVRAAADRVGPGGIGGRGDFGKFVISSISKPDQKMPVNVESMKASIGSFRAKQTEQFLAIDVFSPWRRGRSNDDQIIRELRVELAGDSKIAGDDPGQFHLHAVARKLPQPRAGFRKVFRITAIEFPLG